MLFLNNDSEILIGKKTFEELRSDKKLEWFTNGYKYYKPDTVIIKQIQSLKCHNDIRIALVAGSWREDTQALLPKFCKMFDVCKLEQSKLEIYFVDREKNNPDNAKKKFDILRIPTFIIYKKNLQAKCYISL